MFHDRAAATVNTRSPRLDRLVAGTNRVTDIQNDTHPTSRLSKTDLY